MNRTITAMILAATIGAAPAASIACPEDGHDDPVMAKCIQDEKIKNPGITTNEARGNCQGLLSGDGIGRNANHAPDPGPVYPPAPDAPSGGSQEFVPSGDPFVDCLNRASHKYTQMGLSQMEVRAKRDAECGNLGNSAPSTGPVYPPAPEAPSGGSQEFVPSGDPFVDCLNRASHKYTQMGLSQMEVRAKRDVECGNLGNSAPSTGPVYPPAPEPAPSQPERASNEDPNARQQCIRQHVEKGTRNGMSNLEAQENAERQCRK